MAKKGEKLADQSKRVDEINNQKKPSTEKSQKENIESDEEDKEKELKEKSIYVKVSDEIREIIDKYKEEGSTISSIIEDGIRFYDDYYSMSPEILAIFDKYKDQYQDKSALIEEALKLLDKQKDPEKAEELDLWCRAREEMQMMLIGKTTFKELLIAAETPEESLDKPIKRNIALDVILWYTGKPIRNITFNEILLTIKKMWIAANYFYFIDLKKESDDQYHLIFKHHQDKRYSNYWLRYFKELFQAKDLSFKCAVEGEAFDETLSLTIKKLHDKNKIELDVI